MPRVRWPPHRPRNGCRRGSRARVGPGARTPCPALPPPRRRTSPRASTARVSPGARVVCASSSRRAVTRAACTSGSARNAWVLLAQQQVVAHAGGGALPYPVHVLGARGLEVEMPWPVVASDSRMSTSPERASRVPGAEAQVLVVPRPVLAVEVDVEELSVPQRLGEPVREVQARHLLVTDLGVEADHLRVLQLIDERQGVSDGREEDVAPRLVGLGLDGKTHGVALFDDVGGEDVEWPPCSGRAPRAHPLRRRTRPLRVPPRTRRCWRRARRPGRGCPRTLRSAKRRTLAVVGGEAAVPEYRVREEVGGHHRDDQAAPSTARRRRSIAVLLSAPSRRKGTRRCRGSSRHMRRVRPGEHGDDGVERRAHGDAENVDPLPAHRPKSE